MKIKALRKMLLEDQKLDAIISKPSGVFRPYAGVSTAVLVFTKTNSGDTDTVWFYDIAPAIKYVNAVISAKAGHEVKL